MRRARQAGFTIIELSVAIIIIVVMIGAVTVGIGRLRRADLTTTSGILDAAVRYLYQLSSLNATPYRLVLDMDNGAWWAEELEADPSPCRSFTVKDVRRKDLRQWLSREERRGKFGKKKGKDEETEPQCPEEERDADGKCPAQGFGAVGGSLLKLRELPKGIRISGVMTTHQQDVQEEGKAYVYFFPNGNVEKAYVYLSTEENTFTVETFPLLGKVKVHSEKLPLSRVLRED